MSNDPNTLFLRLAGLMQSWGTSSRFQLRRTDNYPSKSGVLGLLLCAMGVRRENSRPALELLNRLIMAVRIDRGGVHDWDYHTAGAGIGIRKAKGGIKKTQTTGKIEALLSRRQYLYDASFLVAMQGPKEIINDCAIALKNPVWPVYLGRKCCIPTEPVFISTGNFASLNEALSSVQWQPKISAIDLDDRGILRDLDVIIELPAGTIIPPAAQIIYDVPLAFGFFSYAPRYVIRDQVTVPIGTALQKRETRLYRRRPNHASKQWKDARKSRLKRDHYLCIFCKSPVNDAHHISYRNVGKETDEDLRSMCKLCHNTVSMIEYGLGMGLDRIDPVDPCWRDEIIQKRQQIIDSCSLETQRRSLKQRRSNSHVSFENPC